MTQIATRIIVGHFADTPPRLRRTCYSLHLVWSLVRLGCLRFAMARGGLHDEAVVVNVDIGGCVDVQDGALALTSLTVGRDSVCSNQIRNVATSLVALLKLLRLLLIVRLSHILHHVLYIFEISQFSWMLAPVLFECLRCAVLMVAASCGCCELLLSRMVSIEVHSCHPLSIAYFMSQFQLLDRRLDLLERDLAVQSVALVELP